MVITGGDVVHADLDELKDDDQEFDIDPDELAFPRRMHHSSVLARLNALAHQGVITYDDVDDVYDRWKRNR